MSSDSVPGGEMNWRIGVRHGTRAFGTVRLRHGCGMWRRRPRRAAAAMNTTNNLDHCVPWCVRTHIKCRSAHTSAASARDRAFERVEEAAGRPRARAWRRGRSGWERAEWGDPGITASWQRLAFPNLGEKFICMFFSFGSIEFGSIVLGSCRVLPPRLAPPAPCGHPSVPACVAARAFARVCTRTSARAPARAAPLPRSPRLGDLD